MTSDAEAGMEKAIARLRRVTRPKHPLAHFGMILWAAQQFIIELLDSVFYIAFAGKTGSGKGTSLESALLLTPKGGEVLSASSTANLAQALDEHLAIGIPELESAIETNPALLKVLLDGYRRGPKHGLMVQGDDGKWKRASRDIFGAKAYDFHTSAPAHLLGRSLVFDMVESADARLALTAEKKGKVLLPIQGFLASVSEEVRKTWTKERVDELWESEAFLEEVEALNGKTGRDHVLAGTLLLLCKLYGWESFIDKIPALMDTRKTVADDSDEAEVRDAIESLAGETPGPEEVWPTNTVLERINDARKRITQRPMTAKGLGKCLVDLGYIKGKPTENDASWYRPKSGPHRDLWVVCPHKVAHVAHVAQKTLEGGSPSIEPALEDRIGPDGPVGPDSVGPPVEEEGFAGAGSTSFQIPRRPRK